MSNEDFGNKGPKMAEVIGLDVLRQRRREKLTGEYAGRINAYIQAIEEARGTIRGQGLELDELLADLFDKRLQIEPEFPLTKEVREKLGHARVAYTAAVKVLEDRERALTDVALLLTDTPKADDESSNKD